VNFSAIIMELEKIALQWERNEVPREKIASDTEQQAELLFRLAGRIRYGRENG
jgi:hypothetical protein